ncbi:3-deoxy-manno-octulosonate cytidylyltransferase [Devosia pacifica]|uniref:3-deoxy-manno-octulosonate cytidylyltransferase n=1 Tax=Devosia pacifica TaxID=1335967 RepID=A0A918RZ13_9HYPH|nr:3-deoxy-manno-octulosonate cytidylyltransferase [Devosia pacifica]GHA14287.1 3-deoxy-manno-octulosonate cytidylyltransferase [Devosia pacifica]
MQVQVVIPARYNSGRLPGKPLIDLDGMPMVERTWRRCISAIAEDQVLVATDDQRIADHCESVGIRWMMTSPECLTGTDRVAEVATRIDADYFVNVQGDEPLINPDDISRLIVAARNAPHELHLGITEIFDEREFRNPTIPKAVFRKDGRLLYVSRTALPSTKYLEFRRAWRPVWVYGFPPAALADYAAHEGKGVIEEIEDNECLRFLEMGYDIRLVEMSAESVAVDTPEDAERVRRVLAATYDTAAE